MSLKRSTSSALPQWVRACAAGAVLAVGATGLATGPLASPASAVTTSGALSTEELADPGSESRPGMRWWWQTPISEAEALREVRAIAEAGFSSVEIAFSATFWASDVQRQVLGVVLDEAETLGVEVSMTMGAAWPVQTPNTGIGTPYVQKELQYGRVDVAAGTAFSGALPLPLDDAAGERPAELVAVTAARVLEAGPVVAGEAVPPEKSTVLDPESVVDLTATVVDGTVSWTAPAEGDWILFAYWQRDAEQNVTSAFDPAAAKAATEYLDEHQIGDNGEQLGKVGGDLFEDSLELHADSLFWTPDFLDSFEDARGYDPTAYLPFFFAHGMSHYWVPNEEPTPDFAAVDETGERVRSDYYTTLTDLYVDGHLKPYQEWAEGYGVDFKTQPAYGQNLDVIRSAREMALMGAGIEGESLNSGDRFPVRSDEATWRFALDWQRTLVAGAHQGGANRVSSELGAQFQGAFEITLNDYQQLMDKEWAAGLTQPYVHGYASQADDAPWPTQDRFWGLTGESWNDETYPQWAAWSELTDYWARGTLVLETGTPKTDVAIYSTDFLTTSARGVFDPSEDATAPDQLFETRGLENHGYSVQYLDPKGLVDAGAVRDETLFPDGPAYQALVIDERSIDGAAAEALADASSNGLAIVVVGDAPKVDSSFTSGEAGNAKVEAAMSTILASANTRTVPTQADVQPALEDLGVSARVSWNDAPVLTQYRQSGDTTYVYLYNTSSETVDFAPEINTRGAVSEIDLWEGERNPVAQFTTTGTSTVVPLSLEPLGTTVIEIDSTQEPWSGAITNAEPLPVTFDDGGSPVWTATATDAAELTRADGSTASVSAELGADRAPLALDTWDLQVTSAAADGGATIQVEGLTELKDWREIPGLEDKSGTGAYTSTIDLPESWFATGAGVELDIEGALGTSVVSVNGTEVSRHVGRDTTHDITDALRPGENVIEIELATTLRNAVSAAGGVPAPFPNPGQVKTHAVGLTGPVHLISTQQVPIDATPEPSSTSEPTPQPTSTDGTGTTAPTTTPGNGSGNGGNGGSDAGGKDGDLATTGVDGSLAGFLALLGAVLAGTGAAFLIKKRRGRVTSE
ncbi:glycosyl hydrolase [Pseudoclavibacter sp. AY1F1]|uniref:glycosyl hydrolase n=1 Tax=Pseudoclavibacter sp. AY1F1 TaxID=2080583 RepID=UPI0011B0309D|nr:glycosyl hydrolase [Pseudoclavibacter sp. AY1F1]